MNDTERKTWLENQLKIADDLKQRKTEEYNREVNCPLCRDYFILNIQYFYIKKDETGFERKHDIGCKARCSCEGAANSAHPEDKMKSLTVIFDKTDKFYCVRCKNKILATDEGQLKTVPNGAPGIMDVVCNKCFTSNEFEIYYNNMLREYIALCEKMALPKDEERPKFTKEQLLNKILGGNQHDESKL